MKTPESYILDACLAWLAAEHIFALRMNVVGFKIDNRFIRAGIPGQADILAFPSRKALYVGMIVTPTWIECKAPGGTQSALQKSFQEKVESEHHRYIVVRSVDELQEAIGK